MTDSEDGQEGDTMATEWLMNVRDTEIAADIEREIEIERSGGSPGSLRRMNYATGLFDEDDKPAEASDAVQAQ
jgi:hypothetical protein